MYCEQMMRQYGTFCLGRVEEVLFTAQDPVAFIFLLEAGEIIAKKEGHSEINFQPGAFLGLQEIYAHLPFSRTAIFNQSSYYWKLSKLKHEVLFKENPEFRLIMLKTISGFLPHTGIHFE